jgi:molybdate transport system substrate-binding protein
VQQSRALTAASGAHPPRRRRPRTHAAIALAVALSATLSALAGCGAAPDVAEAPTTELRVFAAASLTDAFTAIGEQFMSQHPGVRVTFNFAGSQDLATQLEQGAPADVLATADEATMARVAALVGQPRTFAANRLQIAVAPGNPTGVQGLADLARDDLKVVVAAPEVPAGKYALQALDKAGVSVDPVSLEDSVKGVITKVSLGEVDAGIVYLTDVKAAGGDVDGVAVPGDQNITAAYPIARVKAGASGDAAQAFIDLVLSGDGQRVLRDAGFEPPGT